MDHSIGKEPDIPLKSANVNEGLPPHPPLPIRDRSSSSRPGGAGRHRRPVPSDLPPDAPALVVAAPGRDDEVPQDIARMLRVDNPQVDVRLVHLGTASTASPRSSTRSPRPGRRAPSRLWWPRW